MTKIRRGAWLRWAYENLPERDYLNTLRAVRADQRAETWSVLPQHSENGQFVRVLDPETAE